MEAELTRAERLIGDLLDAAHCLPSTLLAEIAQLLTSVEMRLAEGTAEMPLKARLLFLAAGLQLLLERPGADVEAQLLRSIKMDPTTADAYHCLADVFAARGETENCRRCVEDGLRQRPTKLGLRYRAILLRQAGGDAREAVTTAKAAVALDVDDAQSWLVLGNCYLAKWLAAPDAAESLSRAFSSYANAVNSTGKESALSESRPLPQPRSPAPFPSRLCSCCD